MTARRATTAALLTLITLLTVGILIVNPEWAFWFALLWVPKMAWGR